MARRYVDCRDFPNSHCSVALSADTTEELLEVAVQHGTTAHDYQDTPEFREEIQKHFKEGSPPS
jgi:predicted small metal-binding protein